MKLQSKVTCFILFFLLFLLKYNFAYSQSYFIKNYSIENGLPTNFIYDVTQDKKGRMWFATSVGVSVYDGLQWDNLDTLKGLSNIPYRRIYTDEKGNVWCLPGYMCGVLVCYVEDSAKIIPLPEKRKNENELVTTSFVVNYENNEPVICIGTFYGLYVNKNNSWKRYTVSDGLLDNYIYSIIVHKNKFYIPTKGGISVFDGVKFDNEINKILPSRYSEVYKLSFDSDTINYAGKIWATGKNWIGYIDNGKFNLLNDKFVLPAGFEYDYPSLISGKNGLLFFGNFYITLYINKKTGELFKANNAHGFCSDGSTAIFVDEEDNVWITGTRGVDKVNNLYLINYNSSFGLEDNEVTAINEYEQGKFIIGHNNSYAFFDGEKSTKIIFPEDKHTYLGYNRVMDIFKEDNGTIWLSCAMGGLGKIDKTGKLKWIKLTENVYINSVSKDKKGNIIVVTDRGVFIVNNDKLERSQEFNLIRQYYFRKIFVSDDGEIYFASSIGLVRKKDENISTFTSNTNIHANNVYAVLKDKSNRVFVGTKGGLFTIKNEVLVKFNDNGFEINKSIYAIIQDRKGNYWFGTEDGVVKWDGKSKAKIISKRNGLSGMEINRGALFEDSKGYIWIGTESGLTCYRPEYDEEEIPIPKVVLYTTEDDEGIVYPLSEKISLNSTIKTLNFNFRGVSYYNENSLKYRIKLEGFDADWYEVNQSQIGKIRYTNLIPGEYKLLVSAKNISGEWSKVAESSSITIKKPFYKSWWFIILVFVFIALSMFHIYRLYIVSIYNKKLEKQVEERTHRLMETENALRKSQAELEEKVKERTSELEVANTQLKELNASKDKFFSIIAHDMKSPFTGLLGYTELLKNEAHLLDKNRIIEYSENLYKNLKNTYNLLENLLNWALLQTGRMTFKPDKVDLFLLTQGILELLKTNSVSKNITIKNLVPINTIIKVDKNMLRTILYNLVSNGIKFTNRGGEVVISSGNNNGLLEISVSDNGIGIPDKFLSVLFKLDSNLSTKGTENERGTGLGLILCKEMVEKHNGKISVESKVGIGTEFKMLFPLL